MIFNTDPVNNPAVRWSHDAVNFQLLDNADMTADQSSCAMKPQSCRPHTACCVVQS